MPWYTRKSYFGPPCERGDLTHSLVLEAADASQAIKLASKARFLPGTTHCVLLDEKGGLIRELNPRRLGVR